MAKPADITKSSVVNGNRNHRPKFQDISINFHCTSFTDDQVHAVKLKKSLMCDCFSISKVVIHSSKSAFHRCKTSSVHSTLVKMKLLLQQYIIVVN